MPQSRIQDAAASEGGVRHGSNKKCGGAAFLYLSHSAVVIPCESARLASDAGNRERRERPPPNRGGHVTLSRGMLRHTSTRSHAGRSRPHLSLREGLEQPPFPLALHRVGSVLAVKGSLRRFAPWTAAARSEGMTVYEGKGGVGARGRVTSE